MWQMRLQKWLGAKRSNLDRVCKQRVIPFVQRPHKIRLGMDCPTSLTNEGGLSAQSFEDYSVCEKRAVLVYGKRNSWLTDPLLNLAIGYELVQWIASCQLSGRPMTSGEIARWSLIRRSRPTQMLNGPAMLGSSWKKVNSVAMRTSISACGPTLQS
jgi:hypothetical protein